MSLILIALYNKKIKQKEETEFDFKKLNIILKSFAVCFHPPKSESGLIMYVYLFLETVNIEWVSWV